MAPYPQNILKLYQSKIDQAVLCGKASIQVDCLLSVFTFECMPTFRDANYLLIFLFYLDYPDNLQIIFGFQG